MHTIGSREAKAHRSRLVDEAAAGDPFIFAKAGKPVVRLDTSEPAHRSRLGFMARQATGPGGFDTLGALTIEDLLQGAPLRSA